MPQPRVDLLRVLLPDPGTDVAQLFRDEDYHVQVDEMIEVGDSVVVLVRDRGLRHGMDAEVELISGSLWTFRERQSA